MTDDERQFLLAEFDQSWAMILNIDERRFKFVEYYSAIVTAIAAVVSTLVVRHHPLTVVTASMCSGLLLVGVLVGQVFRSMVTSERAANVRYRHKVNLLRGLFLESSDDPRIAEYLTHKELGIKTGQDEQPSGIGSTLRGVVGFLALESLVLVLTIPVLWLFVVL